jgi:hypothetical protein
LGGGRDYRRWGLMEEVGAVELKGLYCP